MNPAQMEKMRILREASAAIKTRFTSLDKQIDTFANMISPWFVSPEVLTRPIVINIWGMTGVGKTQMVRDFLKELRIASISATVTCGADGVSGLNGAFSEIMVNSDKYDTIHGVVFLDEFQNVRSKGLLGERKPNSSANGTLWEILSTGVIRETVSKADMLNDYACYNSRLKRDSSPRSMHSKVIDSDASGSMSFWTARALKRRYNIKATLFEIIQMKTEDILKIVTNAINNFSEVVVQTDYRKCLFIVCGNLDSAFSQSTNVSRVDVDPDIVHEACKDVSIFDVKRALSDFLFPEEIARLGNNHIIFYSINRQGYSEIIQKEFARIKEYVLQISKKNIEFDQTLFDAIYKNGVFPMQGARSVFSTITGMVESLIPTILFESNEKESTITLAYDMSEHMLTTSEGKKYKCTGPVDEALIRLNRDSDEKRCTSVHETGHALVYAELFGAIPPTMVSVVADSYVAAGFISTHSIRHTRVTMRNFIAVAVAGMVAEETIFGKDFRTVGCCSDLMSATNMAANYFRTFAFSDSIKAVVGSEVNFYNNIQGTSEPINKMVKECIELAADVIHNNIEVLKEISETMFDKCKISPEEFKEISDKHGKTYKLLKFNAKITPNFQQKYEAFDAAEVKDVTEMASEAVQSINSFYKGDMTSVSTQDEENEFLLASENTASVAAFEDLFS